MEKNHCVYVHTNLLNGKKYVGRSVDPIRRWGKDGKNYKGQYFYREGIEKYGWDNFAHDIVASYLTLEEAKKVEREYIHLYDTLNEDCGYNKVDGDLYDIDNTDHCCLPVICLETGIVYKSLTDAAEKVGSDRGGGSNIGKVCIGTRGYAYGYHWAMYDETIDYTQSPYYQQPSIPKISKGKKRKVRCIETGKIYDSARQAGLELGIKSYFHIGEVCRGDKNQQRKKAYGYTWEFVE